MTQLLLDHGADPTLPEEGAPSGLSLWIAVNDRQHGLVQSLLAHGADPNGAVESSGTPMSQAAKDEALTALLRQHGGRASGISDRDHAMQLMPAKHLIHLLIQRITEQANRAHSLTPCGINRGAAGLASHPAVDEFESHH